MRPPRSLDTLRLAFRALTAYRNARGPHPAIPAESLPSLLSELARLASDAGTPGAQMSVSIDARRQEISAARPMRFPRLLADKARSGGSHGIGLRMWTDGGGEAWVRLTAYEGGLPHGFRPGAPGQVTICGSSHRARLFYRGFDVTETVAGPDAAPGGVPDPVLRGLTLASASRRTLDAVEGALAVGDLVVVTTDTPSGLYLVIRPGTEGTRRLMDEAEFTLAERRWMDEGLALTHVFNTRSGSAEFFRTSGGNRVDGLRRDREQRSNAAAGGTAWPCAGSEVRGDQQGPAFRR